jgi:hypothetical protein
MNDDKTIFDEKVPVQETHVANRPGSSQREAKGAEARGHSGHACLPERTQGTARMGRARGSRGRRLRALPGKGGGRGDNRPLSKEQPHLQKEAFVLKERLEKELGHKVVLGKTRRTARRSERRNSSTKACAPAKATRGNGHQRQLKKDVINPLAGRSENFKGTRPGSLQEGPRHRRPTEGRFGTSGKTLSTNFKQVSGAF